MQRHRKGPTSPGMRWFVPEVVQTSSMDCGPASLKAVLEGFGVPVRYGRLREACRTSVDGTSINTIEDILVGLGFEAEQVMLPLDHIFLKEAKTLPAVVLTKRPDGSAHFSVAWRRHGPLVQVMDPAVGRRWPSLSEFADSLLIHSTSVPTADWLAWTKSNQFLTPLHRRIRNLGISDETGPRWLEKVKSTPDPLIPAGLDASVRFVTKLVESGVIRRGREAITAIEEILESGRHGSASGNWVVPDSFWFVRPSPESEDEVLLKGAVLIRISGKRAPVENSDFDLLPGEIREALKKRPAGPGRDLVRLMFGGKPLVPAVVLGGLFVGAGSILFEGLFFRGLIEGGRLLESGPQRGLALIALVVLLLLRGGLKVPLTVLPRLYGRVLEIKLRIALFEKIPRLRDQYFRSRLISDMAERAHMIHALGEIPVIWTGIAEASLRIAALTAGLIWLAPESIWKIVTMAFLSVATPFSAYRILSEPDLRVRTHAGALTRFIYDSLLGLAPVRSHQAELALERNHEALVVDWSVARRSLLRAGLLAETLLGLSGYGLMAWLVWGLFLRNGQLGGVLLFVYWGLRIPALGMQIAALIRRLPSRWNIFIRLRELLEAPEEADATSVLETVPENCREPGVSIRMSGVEVRSEGRRLLADVDLSIEPGEHVAIVGPSGAGKSTLVGLLMGFTEPSRGLVEVDRQACKNGIPPDLRSRTAWVDPEVRLWNMSLLDNLFFGNPDPDELPDVIERCGLFPLLESRAFGLKSTLGEGGTLVSGGEGQRIRLARAMLKKDVRLTILDETFRGLHRFERRRLLAAARERWKTVTLLFVTHEIEESLGFDRVLVLDRGRIVQDGRPAELANSEPGLYSRMLSDHKRAQDELFEETTWRRFQLDSRGIVETGWFSDAG